MQKSIIGFPRVGKLRELKFATEKYFKKEITKEELEDTAKELRKEHWKLQKNAEVDFIPSNDFSFYDGMLDLSMLLNATPARYRELKLEDLDSYFAMARGYQGEKGDVKAFSMKKWFNTNYHYMVPELDDSTKIGVVGDKPFAQYVEAKEYGIDTKPVIIGGFTFLKLANYKGKKTIEDYVNEVAEAYIEILNQFNILGVSWVQFDEPILVTDLSRKDIEIFTSIYQKILMHKGNVKVLLQTYFGDVRDCYQELINLDFDGIGLDFLEGKKTIELIKENGFPKDKQLFAGIVNGKNIWKCDYKKALHIIEEIKSEVDNIVIGTSCSLLHVPYTLENETKLPENIIEYFAFAKEKLVELQELVVLIELQESCTQIKIQKSGKLVELQELRTFVDLQKARTSIELQEQGFLDELQKLELLDELQKLEPVDKLQDIGIPIVENSYANDKCFIRNQEIFQAARIHENKQVQENVKSLTDIDFLREPARNTREKIQKAILNLPLFPTTTIGSFPQTTEVKQNRTRFRQGEISKTEYDRNVKVLIKKCIKLQEDLGLDVLVHGEYERNDMVEFFGENLEGYVFTEKAWVQSYGTRCVKPPIIFGDIRRAKPITVEYAKYASGLTKKPVKGMLTGPVTILNWSFPREDISLSEMAFQIGLAIKEEVLDLEKAGVAIIQIDEAALKEKLPIRKVEWDSEYLDWAIKAFRLCHSKVKPETQIHTHMCYSEFEEIVKDIDNMDADVISFEASRSNLTILDALQANRFETEVGPGVYDIHSPRVPSVSEIEDVLKVILKKVDKDKLWVNPDCGLKTRGIKETNESLKNLVEAVKNLRKGWKVKE